MRTGNRAVKLYLPTPATPVLERCVNSIPRLWQRDAWIFSRTPCTYQPKRNHPANGMLWHGLKTRDFA